LCEEDTLIGILKINEEQKVILQSCRTDEDIKGFTKSLGVQLSEEDLDTVCGGLEAVEPENMQEELDRRMRELMEELQEKGMDVNVLFPRESPAFPGPRNIHMF
jgi:hypothetical protein